MIFLEIIEEKDPLKSEIIDSYQQNYVYFVNIASKFIMVPLLIVGLGWPLNTIFVRTVAFLCALSQISGVFTTHSIS